MVRRFKNITIREYLPKDRDLIENFRYQSYQEGNNSLSLIKYDPDNINGQTFMLFVEEKLASISVCEASHYTGDPDIAARICRYHILRKYRHCNAGFRMLPKQTAFAKKEGFKLIYWTQNTQHKALNALYQHKYKMPGKTSFFESDLYKSFRLNDQFLFKVSPKSDLLQYIYFKTFQAGYIWRPKRNIILIKS